MQYPVATAIARDIASNPIVGGMYRLPTLPSGYGWFTQSVYLSDTMASSTFSFEAVKPTSGNTYYVSQTGSSGADGLTPATALYSIGNALAKSNCGRIVITSEYLDRNRYPSTAITLTQDLVIESSFPTGTIMTGSDIGSTWTQNVTYSNVYQRTRGNVASVRDATWLDSNGFWRPYTLRTTVADVAANPGSYYIDGSNICYVSCFNGRVIDNNIHVFLNVLFIVQGPYKLWMNNVSFAGVQSVIFRNTAAGVYPTVYLQNGWSRYNNLARNGISFLGVDSYCKNFRCDANSADGFNYHILNTRNCNAYEENCSGYWNGDTGTGNNNGSTIHDGGSIIRLNCDYQQSEGPNYSDISAGSKIINICCKTGDSRESGVRTGFSFSECSGWLINCKVTGTQVADVQLNLGSVIRYFGPTPFTSVGSPGTLTRVSNLQDIFA